MKTHNQDVTELGSESRPMWLQAWNLNPCPKLPGAPQSPRSNPADWKRRRREPSTASKPEG